MSSFLSRVLRPTPEAQPAPAAPARRPLPPTGQLRRERRTLLRLREQRIRDLGGIVLEMVRRDEFREDLIYEQAADLIGLEDRLHELELLLSAATGVHRSPPSARCACGAPVLWGQHFCANCGRPAGDALVACTSCGHALPAAGGHASCAATVPQLAQNLASAGTARAPGAARASSLDRSTASSAASGSRGAGSPRASGRPGSGG